jgi:DNA-binding NtrC family response regulator
MQSEIHSEPDFGGITRQSPVLKTVLALAREMAVSDAPVLIFGEAGSGKESSHARFIGSAEEGTIAS